MSLADDVATLREIAMASGLRGESHKGDAIARVLPLLTKLGELSPEQAEHLAQCCTFAAADAEDDLAYFRSSRFAVSAAAHRTAAEVFKMLGGGT